MDPPGGLSQPATFPPPGVGMGIEGTGKNSSSTTNHRSADLALRMRLKSFAYRGNVAVRRKFGGLFSSESLSIRFYGAN